MLPFCKNLDTMPFSNANDRAITPSFDKAPHQFFKMNRKSHILVFTVFAQLLTSAVLLHAAEPIKAFTPGSRILFQGDSITDGKRGRNADPNHILGHGYVFIIAARQGAAFPEAMLDFINRGVSGNTAPNLEQRWQKDALDLKPDTTVLLLLKFDKTCQLPSSKRQPLTFATLDEVYRARVLGPTCKHYFDHYRERLKRFGRTVEKSAVAVLSTVAEKERVSESVLYDVYRKARGRGASELGFNELMADLECDWYLVLDPHTNEYFFMVDVIRDWWRRWHRAPKGKEA